MSRSRSATRIEQPIDMAVAAGTTLSRLGLTVGQMLPGLEVTGDRRHDTLWHIFNLACLYTYLECQRLQGLAHCITDWHFVPEQARCCHNHHAFNSIGRAAVAQRWMQVNQVSVAIPPACAFKNHSRGRQAG